MRSSIIKSATALAAFAASLAVTGTAQAAPPPPPGTNFGGCTTAFTNPDALACAGYFSSRCSFSFTFAHSEAYPREAWSRGPGIRGCGPASVSGTVVRDGTRSRCVAYASTCRACSLLPHPAAHTESQRHPRWRAAADAMVSAT